MSQAPCNPANNQPVNPRSDDIHEPHSESRPEGRRRIRGRISLRFLKRAHAAGLPAAVGLAVLGLAACGPGGPPRESGVTGTTPPAQATVAVEGEAADVVPPDLGDGHLPAPLEQIQETSARLFETVPAGDREAVDRAVETVERSRREWAETSDYADVPEELRDAVALRVRELREAAATGEKRPTLRAANNLEMAVLDLYEFYHLDMPADLGRLEVAERDLLLDTAAHDPAAAQETVVQIGSLWAGLRPTVEQMGDAKLAAELDTVVTSQQQAAAKGDLATLDRLANQALDVIGRMEAQTS